MLRQGILQAVEDISFTVKRVKMLCFVGASDSGKIGAARSILQIVPAPGTRTLGRMILRTVERSSDQVLYHDRESSPVDVTARIGGAANREEMLARCLERTSQGFLAIGHLNPFLDEDRSVPYGKPHARKTDAAVSLVAELRQVLGPDVDLCIEIHRRLASPEAIDFDREIAPFHPLLFEDPIPPTTSDSMARAAVAIDIPIATGERFSSLQEFQSHLSRGALSFARNSLYLCSGITDARKITAPYEAFDIDVVAHNALSPVSLVACMQLNAAVPSFTIQEYPTAMLEEGETEGPETDRLLRGRNLVTSRPALKVGYVDAPDAPGLGTRPSKAGCTAPLSPRTVSIRTDVDGFVVDQ